MPQSLRKPTPPEHLPATSVDQLNLWAELTQLVEDWKNQAGLLYDSERRDLRAEAKVMRRMAGQTGVILNRFDQQYQTSRATYERNARG